MSVSSILHTAVSHRTGGERIFSTSCDDLYRCKYAYQVPDDSYAKLFFRQATACSSQQPSSAANQSAGLLIPDEPSDCHPVIIGHSFLAIIWLMREILPEKTLTEGEWRRLIDATQMLSTSPATPPPPPSAQRPAPVHTDDSELEEDEEDIQTLVRKRKEPLELLSQPARKRVHTLLEEEPQPSEDADQEETGHEDTPYENPGPDPSEEDPRCVVTITNNNRRAELAREKKRVHDWEQRKESLGLISPPKGATLIETQAYDTILQNDAVHFSWLFKQSTGNERNFYESARSPYRTASDMLSKARAVGSQETWSDAASFLRSWRQQGSPFYAQKPTAPSSQIVAYTRSSNGSDAIRAFQHAWQICDYFELELASVTIKYRWAMAHLYHTYIRRVAEIEEADRTATARTSRNRYGRGQVRTQAARDLLQSISSNSPSEAEMAAFRQRRTKAKRWYMAAQTLGWGSLCLMPPDVISNKWAERALTIPEWEIWLNLIKKVQPDACTASMGFDAWLGEKGIEGGPIKDKKPLCIEARSVVYEVEEIADSEEEGDSDDSNRDDEESNSNPTPASALSQKSAPQLRQLTLLELFKPQ